MHKHPFLQFLTITSIGAALLGGAVWLRAQDAASAPAGAAITPSNTTMSANSQEIILAGGCFWCTEAVFERLDGVTKVVSGYAGGEEKNPTYKQVSAGATNHAEVIHVTFDPSVISFDKILEVFWKAHDPTTLNRQGNDIGKQYRSAIYYYTDEQKAVIDKSLAEAQTQFDSKITTEVKKADVFYPAEGYHQNYFHENPNDRYCNAVLVPKLNKLEKSGVIKEERNKVEGL